MSRFSARLTVLFGVLALAACIGASAAGARTWVATHTQALHLTGRLLGTAAATQRLEISAVLPLRDTSGIDDLIESRTILTPAQVRARFGPTAATVDRVERYLRSNGFRQLAAASDGLLVTGRATVAQAQRAFHTAIASYRLNGRVVYANSTAAMVPAALRGDIVAVLGLSDIPMRVPHLQ